MQTVEKLQQEIKNEMISAIGTSHNALVDSIAESCTIVALKHIATNDLKTQLEQEQRNLNIAICALEDIAKWDNDLEQEWEDPGIRAKAAIEEILT